MLHGWLLLLLSLPPRPSSLRVRAWRRLRGLGAVPLRSSAYLLPDSPDRYEQFQWLAQEIQRDGGEATLLRVDRIEHMQRPDVVRHLQGSDDAIFAPTHHGGFTRPEREAAALRVATLLRDSALEEHYQRRLVALCETSPLTGARGEAIFAHIDCVTMMPDRATKADIDRLLAVGLTPHAVLSLSQLIAYVNFQSRVLAGLRMLRDAS